MHNHILEDTPAENLEARYPSNEDWDRVHGLVLDGKYPDTVTIYLIDPMGETRAFPYASMAQFRSQSPQEGQQGAGLPASLTAGSCTDLRG